LVTCRQAERHLLTVTFSAKLLLLLELNAALHKIDNFCASVRVERGGGLDEPRGGRGVIVEASVAI
jgi:hypothetical protein